MKTSQQNADRHSTRPPIIPSAGDSGNIMPAQLSTSTDQESCVAKSTGIGLAKLIGWGLRQLRNLIRRYRDREKVSGGPEAPNCTPVLLDMLNWIDIEGDHVPLILIDVERNAKKFLNGHQTLGQWQKTNQDLQERYCRQGEACSTAQLMAENSRMVFPPPYLM